MSLDIMAIVLFGAMLHAGWNALVRASSRKFLDTVLIVLGAGVWTAFFLPLIPVPAVASWPYLAASVLIHVFPRRVFVSKRRTEFRISADERLGACADRSCRSTIDK